MHIEKRKSEQVKSEAMNLHENVDVVYNVSEDTFTDIYAEVYMWLL